MNHFFHVNGPVFTFLSKFCDVLIISILWTLFCLPVVTVGPACAALYHTVHKSLLKSDGYILPFLEIFLFQPETRDPTDPVMFIHQCILCTQLFLYYRGRTKSDLCYSLLCASHSGSFPSSSTSDVQLSDPITVLYAIFRNF